MRNKSINLKIYRNASEISLKNHEHFTLEDKFNQSFNFK